MVGISYGAGFLVVNAHLGHNGFEWLGLIDATYFAAGLWSILPILVGYLTGSFLALLITAEPGRREDNQADPAKAASRFTTASRLSLVGAVTAFVPASLVVWLFDAYRLLIIIWATIAMILGIIAVVSAESLANRVVAALCVALTPAGLGYKVLVAVGAEPTSAWWLLPIGLGAILAAMFSSLFPGAAKIHQNANGVALICLLAPAYFATFAVNVYPDIPAHLAGGRPAMVRLLAHQSSQADLQAIGVFFRSDARLSEPVALFRSSGDYLFIKPARSSATIVHRAAVEAITFEKR